MTDIIDFFVRFHYVLAKQFNLKQLHSKSQSAYIETLLGKYFPDDSSHEYLLNETTISRSKRKPLPPELLEDARRLVFRNVIWALRKNLPIYDFYNSAKEKLEIKVDIENEDEFNLLKSDFLIEYLGIRAEIVDYIKRHYPMLEKANMAILIDFLDGINIVPKLYTKLQIAAGEYKKNRNISQGDKEKIFSYQMNLCFYCGSDMSQNPHADHFIPYDYVLDSKIWNIVGACPRCNNKKKNYLVNSDTVKKIIDRNNDPKFRSLFSEFYDCDSRDVEKLLDQHYKNCALYFKVIKKEDLVK